MKAAVMDTVIGGRDDAEVFARAKQIGCAGVEIVVGRHDLRDAQETRLEALRQAMKTTGLEVHALVMGEHNEKGGLADEDPEAARQAHTDVRDATAWARELGAGAVLIPFFMRAELEHEADVERAAAAFPDRCVRSRPGEE